MGSAAAALAIAAAAAAAAPHSNIQEWFPCIICEIGCVIARLAFRLSFLTRLVLQERWEENGNGFGPRYCAAASRKRLQFVSRSEAVSTSFSNQISLGIFFRVNPRNKSGVKTFTYLQCGSIRALSADISE